jgi:ABC-2 type transport system permease protein
MREVWVTARHEIRITLGRKTFWLMTFLLPALVLLLVLLPEIFTGGGDSGGLVPDVDEQTQTIGYVDPAGVLHTAPAGLPPDLVRSFNSEAEAKAELEAGSIDRYYLIAEDYLLSGGLTVVQTRFQPLRALEGRELITFVINTGITGDEAVAGLLLNPTAGLESRSLDPAGPTASANAGANVFLPYSLMFVLYMALAMTSGFLLQSVSREKENRTAEVLLSSVSPRNLMFGKILGLSAVGLLQVAIWLAAIFAVLLSRDNIFGVDLNISGEFVARVIPWTIVYFFLGYLLYASLYAVLGVLAPTARDANQFVFIAIIPLVVPLLFSGYFGDRPNGTLSTTLSLFPLTSPVAMVARLGATPVPWWQLAAGAVALAVVAYLIVLLAGRLFRADNLLSTRALTWGRLQGELRPLLARVTGTNRAAGSGPGVGTNEAEEDTGATDAVGQPGRSRIPKIRPIYSRQRVWMLGLVGVAMLILGIREYLRGDSSGIIIAVAGAFVAGSAYYRYRRHR